MKKFLVMLLAVSMVLSMSVALASCGEDTPATSSEDAASTDSTAESTEASKEESTAASKDEETSEAPSADTSADITSEDITSEDVSVEESSAAPAYEYKTSPAGTNYSTNATYTVTRDGDSDPANIYLNFANTTDWADADCTKLKDGIVGDCSTYESAIAALAGVSVTYAGTDKAFEFIWDLGDHYGDIKSIVFRQARHGTPNGNNRGFEVKLVQVSDDGINWTKAKGTLTSVQVEGAVEINDSRKESTNIEHFNFTYTLDAAAQGKFVKIVLSNDGGYCLQFEELEIRN